MSAQENNQNGILSTSDIVKHYDEQGLVGSIKIYFKKSDIKTHQSKLDRPYYVIRPLVVKVGEEFDEHPNFSIFLKPKYQYRISLIEADFWVMIIDDETSTFKNQSGEDIEYYNVNLKYITNPKLIDTILKKALAVRNIEEFDEDEV